MAGLKMAETRRQEEGEDGVVEAPLFLTDEQEGNVSFNGVTCNFK